MIKMVPWINVEQIGDSALCSGTKYTVVFGDPYVVMKEPWVEPTANVTMS